MFSDLERNSEHLTVFYTSALQETFGEQFCGPSLSTLSAYWYHPTRKFIVVYLHDTKEFNEISGNTTVCSFPF